MKKDHFQLSTGIISILMIFIVLCLTAFGVLSFASANSDLKMTNKNLKGVEAYYKADYSAQCIISEIDEKLKQLHDNSDNSTNYYNLVEENTKSLGYELIYTYDSENELLISFDIFVDNRVLKVTLNINSYIDSSRYSINAYKWLTAIPYEAL